MTAAPRDEEIRDKLAESIVVDHTLLTYAKEAALRLVLEGGMTSGRTLVEQIVTELGARDPGPLPLHSALEFDWAQVTPYAKCFSAKLAACEAIWSLIQNGLLIHGNVGPIHLERWNPNVETTVPRGFSGHSGHVDLIGLDATFPSDVLPAPSLRTSAHRSLTDGDLFLRDIGVPRLHALIAESLQEAVTCFRHELYLPCLAMLTKAIEGAWTEMGAAIADFGNRVGDSQGTSLRKKLEDPMTGLGFRIERVVEYYRKQVCEDVVTKSGIARSAISQAAIWSDEVRDSRNVLHFGKIPAVPITYERVAVLMMATVGHLRAMYAVKDAAEALP